MTRPHPHPITYEINTRVWIRRFGRQGHSITLDEIPLHAWDALSKLGITYVWLMGVWKTNPETAQRYAFAPELIEMYRHALSDWTPEDVIGSPYAIDDYILDPHIATEEGLNKVRALLRERGMLLMLDFIPNHFGASTPLAISNPECFLQVNDSKLQEDEQAFFKPRGCPPAFAHGRDPHFAPWTDTIQINYARTEAHRFMIEKLLSVSKRCDAIRCDMAMLVLNEVFQTTWREVLEINDDTKVLDEFWPQAISSVKSRFPHVRMIAEAYWGLEWRLLEMGFDFVYDKRLLDLIRLGNTPEIHRHLQATLPHQSRTVHFLENHDEERSITSFENSKVKAAAIMIGTLPGMRLFYDGQFEGKAIRLPVQLGREPKESQREDVHAFYTWLLATLQDPMFHDGDWRLLTPSPLQSWDESYVHVLAWLWTRKRHGRLVVINFSPTVSKCIIRMDPFPPTDRIEFVVGVENEWSLELNPFETMILELESK